jgi:putative transposase
MRELITAGTESKHPASIARMCQALSVSRATYSRWHSSQPSPELHTELHHQIQCLALELPAPGYRRITPELPRCGILINYQRVRRVMREDHVLCLRKRSWMHAPDSQPELTTYPKLLPELAVDGLAQLWVAAITYVRLPPECVYLAMRLDAYNRRGIGWPLDRFLPAELALAALRLAFARRSVRPGRVHHSDRGVHYASHVYIDLLKAHGIRISMSRRGHPYDNTQAESFNKTLKMRGSLPLGISKPGRGARAPQPFHGPCLSRKVAPLGPGIPSPSGV